MLKEKKWQYVKAAYRTYGGTISPEPLAKYLPDVFNSVIVPGTVIAPIVIAMTRIVFDVKTGYFPRYTEEEGKNKVEAGGFSRRWKRAIDAYTIEDGRCLPYTLIAYLPKEFDAPVVTVGMRTLVLKELSQVIADALSGELALEMPQNAPKQAEMVKQVYTVKEAAAIWGIEAEAIRRAINGSSTGAGNYTKWFDDEEVRKSSGTFILTDRAMRRVFREPGKTVSNRWNPPEPKTYSDDTLKYIYTAAEAAAIWGKPLAEIINICNGQSKMGRRFDETNSRRSCETWLVTDEGMRKNYGEPKLQKEK